MSLIPSVGQDFLDQFLVPTPDSDGTEPTVTLTSRQKICVYMCGVRPRDVPDAFQDSEEASAYVKQCRAEQDSFVAKHPGEAICPGETSSYRLNLFLCSAQNVCLD